jgi:hypothetical protein
MTYSLQLDRHGNAIVCADTRERCNYSIVHTGTYAECNAARPGFESEARASIAALRAMRTRAGYPRTRSINA